MLETLLNISPILLGPIILAIVIFIITGFGAGFLTIYTALLCIPYFIFVGGFFAFIFNKFFNLGNIGEYIGMGIALFLIIIYGFFGSNNNTNNRTN